MNHKTDMQAVLLDAMRVISESADEIKAGCAIDDEWPDAEDKAEYDRRVAVLERVRALASQPAGVQEGEYRRMFEDAVRSLAAIDEALGIDPDEAGGAAPILEAIAELKRERDEWIDANYGADAQADERWAWRTGAPPVAEGKCREFIIAVRRAQSNPPGKVFVFSASYANKFTDDGCLSGRDGDEFVAEGWHLCGLDMSGEFNEVYEPIGLNEGDEIVGWREFPKWQEALAAAPAPVVQSAGVPTGYALVPIEPTVEMIAALGFAGDADIAIGHARAFKETVDAYASMIAAAPAPVSAPEQPSQDEADLCERIIHAVEGECDGLAITEEQASNILAYLQYGAPMCDMSEAFRIVDNAIGAAEECEPEGGNLRIVTLRIDAVRKVRAALAAAPASPCGEDAANVASADAFTAWTDGIRKMLIEAGEKRAAARVDNYSFETFDAGWQARAAVAPTPQQISDYLNGLDAINRALAERGEQERPHGVEDGACKQCYGEAVSGEQGALPQLKEGEEFVCGDGCGTTTPESYDFEYSREEFPDGRVESKTEKGWRASCCKADLMVYSNLEDTFTPIEDYIGSAPTLGGGAAPWQGCKHRVCYKNGACWTAGKCLEPTEPEPWPTEIDAQIKACALMILGICATRPQDEWPKRIEGRIRYMLSRLQPQAAEPKWLTEEQRKSLEHAIWNFDRNRFVEDARNLRALLEKNGGGNDK